MSLIQSPEAFKRLTSLNKREFYQQTAYGLELQLFPESSTASHLGLVKPLQLYEQIP